MIKLKICISKPKASVAILASLISSRIRANIDCGLNETVLERRSTLLVCEYFITNQIFVTVHGRISKE